MTKKELTSEEKIRNAIYIMGEKDKYIAELEGFDKSTQDLIRKQQKGIKDLVAKLEELTTEVERLRHNQANINFDATDTGETIKEIEQKALLAEREDLIETFEHQTAWPVKVCGVEFNAIDIDTVFKILKEWPNAKIQKFCSTKAKEGT
jgi:DNA repair exonuclease SbcCD ATPase subunit